MGAARVLLQPTFQGSQATEGAEHGRVQLSSFGSGSTELPLREKLPAELVFFVAFLDGARSRPDFREFARAAGELERRSVSEVRFSLPPDWNAQNAPPPNSERVSRYLRLSFDPATFTDPSGAAVSGAQRLYLPEVPPLARHVELGVELRVNGAVEAARTANDVLDVPAQLVSYDPAPLRLAVGFPYSDGKLAHRPYRLTVGGRTFQGFIPESGEIVISTPLGDGAATLEVQPFPGSFRWYSWQLNVGELPDADSVEGMQARLSSQGYYAGAVDGDAGPKTRQALRAFQHRHALLADGAVSPQSNQKLKECHGC